MRDVPVSKWVPIALGVGILAAAYVIVARQFNLILWAAFISWPLYFLAGATIRKLDKEVIGLSGGLLAGWGLVQLIPFFSGIFGDFWTLPVLVLLACFVIVFLEIVPEFDMAPAYFLSFASFFAAMGLINPVTGQLYGAGFDTVIKLWIPLMVGLVFAYVNGKFVEKSLSLQKKSKSSKSK